jgi:chromosome segregation ATPase
LPQKGSKERVKQRVCDQCYELHQNDKDGNITETRDTAQQTALKLKAQLKDLHQQASWFKNFLLQINSEVAGGESMDPNAPNSDDEFVEETALEPARLDSSTISLGAATSKERLKAAVMQLAGEDQEVRDLILQSSRRWRATCADVKKTSEANSNRESEISDLEREYRDDAKKLKDICKQNENMERDLRSKGRTEEELHHLQEETTSSQQYRDNLKTRLATLEASLPLSTSSSSGISTVSWGAGSPETGQAERCNRPCVRVGCILM